MTIETTQYLKLKSSDAQKLGRNGGSIRYLILTDTDRQLLYVSIIANCRVPDDWLLKNKRPLLHGREVLREVLATWQARAKELPC